MGKSETYPDPTVPGALGGLARYAKTHRLTLPEARRRLEWELAFTLHKPV